MKISLLLFSIVLLRALLLRETADHEKSGMETIADAACLTRWIEGEIDSIRTRQGKKNIILRCHKASLVQPGEKAIRGRAFIRSRITTELRRGDWIRVYGESVPLSNRNTSGQPSAAMFSPTKISLFPHPNKIRGQLFLLREKISALFSSAGEPIAPFLTAFFLGDRSKIPKIKRDIFCKTGLIHCLTVSGFHVALLTFLLGQLLKPLPAKIRTPAVTLCLALYTLFTGGNPATIRAVLFFTIAGLFPGCHRLGLILFCASLMLTLSPGLLLSLSAILSFTACTGIIVLAPSISSGLKRLYLPGWFRLPVAISLGAQTALVPVLAGSFGRISVIAPLSNAILLPVFLFCCLSAPPAIVVRHLTAWEAPLEIIQNLFLFFEKSCRAISNQPVAVWETGHWDLKATLLWYSSLILVCAFINRYRRRKIHHLGQALHRLFDGRV